MHKYPPWPVVRHAQAFWIVLGGKQAIGQRIARPKAYGVDRPTAQRLLAMSRADIPSNIAQDARRPAPVPTGADPPSVSSWKYKFYGSLLPPR